MNIFRREEYTIIAPQRIAGADIYQIKKITDPIVSQAFHEQGELYARRIAGKTIDELFEQYRSVLSVCHCVV